MKIEFNGKKIEGVLPRAIVLIGAGAVVVLLATVLIPMLGIALGLAIFALAISIALFGWKNIVGKITTKINFFPEELDGHRPCHSELYESMSTDKILVVKCKHGNIVVRGTDDYNKFSIKGKGIHYLEESDSVQIRSHENLEIFCPSSQRLSVFSGTGNVTISSMRAIDLASGSGDVEVHGLVNTLKAAAGAGNFKVNFAPNATSGLIEIALAGGNAEVTLPPKVQVDYAARSLSGEIYTTHYSTPGAPFKISFTAASGDLTIK